MKSENASRPFSTRPKLLSDFNGHTRPLPNTSTSPHIYPPYLRKYNAALRNWGNDIGDRIGASKWSAFSKVFTVEDIANLSPQRHIELIDNIWDEIVEFHEYNTEPPRVSRRLQKERNSKRWAGTPTNFVNAA